jgi:Zn-dependent peptidase ImmA (M78 family)/DNA-binding XRE family transcriptional regulator
VNFSPSRLVIARNRHLLKQKDVAERLDVTTVTVNRWEKGSSVPSQSNLEAFADLLGFAPEFFQEPDLDAPDGTTTSFRSQTNMTALVRDAALAAGAIGFAISDWIESRFALPEPQIPDLSAADPEAAAVELRQQWGLGEKPISHMIRLLESKGVRVFSLAENTLDVNAYSLWRKGKPHVFLNTMKSSECSRFDAAHELGHIVLHQDGKVTGRIAEDQANRFASCFLMPKADLIAQIHTVTHLDQLIQAKKRWKVSVAALAHRLHKVGVISDWKYRDYCIEIARKGYRTCEPEGIDRETSDVWKKVLTALWKEGITQFDIARSLYIPEEEVRGLLFGILATNYDPVRNRSLKAVPRA